MHYFLQWQVKTLKEIWQKSGKKESGGIAREVFREKVIVMHVYDVCQRQSIWSTWRACGKLKPGVQ